MKIVQIVPGSGGSFYCGNCLRDSNFIKAFRKMGFDAFIIPIYLPINIDETKDAPVFYGAVRMYLNEHFSWFRHLPNWLQKWADAAPLLKLASSMAGSTRPEGLEEMTINMFKGDQGHQKAELAKLIHFFQTEVKPDIIHLSNALLAGMAGPIKEALGVPVVCSLQDEHVWLDAMKAPYNKICWDLMTEKGHDVDAFIAVSDYYASFMKERMSLTDDKLFVVRPGIDPTMYENSATKQKPPVIGYLSRLNEENGLHIVVDAFIQLKKRKGMEGVSLHVSGGYTNDNKPFIHRMKKKLKSAGVENDVLFVDDFDGNARHQYLSEISVMTVPVPGGEALGIYQLESLASGVPVVQPAEGVFPEIVHKTNGGIIYEPNTPEALCDALAGIITDQDKLKILGDNGRKGIETYYNDRQMADDMLEVYKEVISKLSVTNEGTMA